MFSTNYLDLLILQYRDLPKASATIEALTSKFEELYNVVLEFDNAFDIDTAVGVQLDTLGKIIGLPRVLPILVERVYFGFAGTLNADTFGKAPLKRLSDNDLTPTELNDSDYRFFLKAKIAKNVVTAKMIDDNFSIQDAVSFVFGTAAYINDNQDMTMTLFVDEDYPTRLLSSLQELDLIPRPQAVDISYAIIVSTETFGFSNNPNSKTFGLGKFARVLTL